MQRIFTYIFWPGLLIAACVGTQIGITLHHPIFGFNIVYVCLATSLWWLERNFPHERKWLENDGQVKVDLAHTLLSKGIVQVLVVVGTIMGLAEWLGGAGLHLWPYAAPVWFQVVLALVVMEFGLYWKHRMAHEVRWLWPFHAVHHSAPRLWFWNTGRFHFVDSVTGLLFGLPLLFVLGAPDLVFSWAAAITAFIGIMTHCNVEMRFGFLSFIFNTPELHRWHHSRKLREGNTNYGENLMLWDEIFGTYFRPDRRPPVNVGISHAMPERFVDQLKAPFKQRFSDPDFIFSEKKRAARQNKDKMPKN